MKILLIKLGALGDVLRTVSLLPAIKDKWKNSHITWLTKKDAVQLIKNNFYVDEIITFDKSSWLKGKSFDLVINLEEDIEVGKLVNELKYREIKGFYLKDGEILPSSSAREWYAMSALGKRPWNDILKKKNKKTWQQIMSETIGIDSEKCYLSYKFTEQQKQIAADFARRYNISKDDLVIGINNAAGKMWPSKALSADKIAKLVDNLHKKLNAKIILFGGPEEISRNNEIIAKAKIPVIYSGSGNNMVEFPALISLCNLFITSDTLGMHLAVALKRKIVAYFSPTSAAEIELFGLGKKIIARHECYCCYKEDCNANNSVSIEEIFKVAQELIKEKLAIVITSYKEPRLEDSIKSILQQEIKYPYELIVADPGKSAEQLVKKYSRKYPIKYFQDPGKGKSYAINLLLEKLKNNGTIFIFTDGDVLLAKDSMNKIAESFKDPTIGCLTGRVVSSNSRNEKYGYWSHLLADAGAHRIRKELDAKDNFLECSGYLFAFRNNGAIKKIPLDVAEDSIIPYYFWKKGYKIKYVPEAIVYVKNPVYFSDWLKQRTRTAKAHETLKKYAPDFPRVKTFSNEASRVFWALSYARNSHEFAWTLELIAARLIMWLKVFNDVFKSKKYHDAWERVESTKV